VVAVVLLVSIVYTTPISALNETTSFTISDMQGKYKTQGRTAVVDGNLMLDYSASGIEFRANCSGDVKVTVNAKSLKSSANQGLYFTVVVDGVIQHADKRIPAENDETWTSNSTGYPFHITKTGNSEFTIAEDLPAGDHTFAIYNQTEPALGVFGIKSITLEGSLISAPENNEHYIEFIGDSITAGFGALSPVDGHYALYQDATRTWPYLTADKLNADWSVVARSSIAATDGLGWSDTGYISMQTVYPKQRYYYNTEINYPFDREPDVVVIALGTNDIMSFEQRGKTLDDVKDGFEKMTILVRDKNPDAAIVWVYGMMTNAADSIIEEVVAELGGNASNYYTLKLPMNKDGGKDHPDLLAQTTYADMVSGYVGTILDTKSKEITVWDGTIPTSMPDYLGEGTENNPYLIQNGTQLYWAVTNTNRGVYFKLAKDIVLNDITVDNTGATPVIYDKDGNTLTDYTSLNSWNTDPNKMFGGTINGDGHVIRGLFIAEDYNGNVADDWKIGYGLVSRIVDTNTQTTLLNLGIEDSYIKTTNSVAAAFIGTLSTSQGEVSLNNCYVGDSVYVYSQNSSGFIGSGGGKNLKIGISNSYVLARIESVGGHGAILGGVWSPFNCTITNCYATTHMYGNEVPNSVNCYTSGTKQQGAVKRVTDDALKLRTLAPGSSYYFTGSYPILKIFAGIPQNVWSGYLDSQIEGSGTSVADPYIIATPEQFAYVVSSGGAEGKYYKLTNDIYFNDVEKMNWNNGMPVGNYQPQVWFNKNTSKIVQGIFDGNGKVVYGLFLNETPAASGTAWTEASSALFPVIGNMSIKNIGVDKSYISATINAGAIFGYAKGAYTDTIEGCFIGKDVTIKGNCAGGIGGSGGGGGIAVSIINCSSQATVEGTASEAGIAANFWGNGAKSIKNCFTTHAKVNASGIASSNNYVNVGATSKGLLALKTMSSLGEAFITTDNDYPVPSAFATVDNRIYVYLNAPNFSGGEGTPANPYEISHPYQLELAINNFGGGYAYELINDIYINDIDAIDWQTGKVTKDGYEPNHWVENTTVNEWHKNYINTAGNKGKFTVSVFDGKGYGVYGLWYDPNASIHYNCGLFPVFVGTIKNLELDNAYSVGSHFIGALAGTLNGSVENVIVDKNVYVTHNQISAQISYGTGGIIGWAENSVTLKNCAFYGQLSRLGNVGGLIGTSWNTKIKVTDCISIGYIPFAVGVNQFTYATKDEAIEGSKAYYDVSDVYTDVANANNKITYKYDSDGVDSNGDGNLEYDVTDSYVAYEFVSVDKASATGTNALDVMSGLDKKAWYAVKNDDAFPSLRVFGTVIGDVDENGIGMEYADVTALRVNIISNINGNADYNGDNIVNICDLVSIANDVYIR